MPLDQKTHSQQVAGAPHAINNKYPNPKYGKVRNWTPINGYLEWCLGLPNQIAQTGFRKKKKKKTVFLSLSLSSRFVFAFFSFYSDNNNGGHYSEVKRTGNPFTFTGGKILFT